MNLKKSIKNIGKYLAVILIIAGLVLFADNKIEAITAAATVAMVIVQGTIMIRQRVETTFYLLVGQWRDVANHIEFGQNWFHGQSVFKDLCNRIESIFLIECKKKNNKKMDACEVVAKEAFKKFVEVDNEEYQLLENYFKNIEHLLHYINRQSYFHIPFKRKEEYLSVIISLLSTYEQKMILLRVRLVNDMKLEHLNNCENLINSIPLNELEDLHPLYKVALNIHKNKTE